MNTVEEVVGREVGSNAASEWAGFFQINVKVPSETGTKAATALVSVLRSLYKRGGTLTSPAGVKVRIQKCVPAGGVDDRTWYIIPVSAWYYAFIEPQP